MRRRFFLVAMVVALASAAGCTRAAGPFSVENARVHVQVLAGNIGSRPVGTLENARARAYVIDQLKLFGYEVRVQETEARRGEFGLAARVANIIATLPGSRREAIGLLSHYDSAPETPGAADDAFGVAVSLEAARLIAARPRNWTTMILVTDAEEAGLMGAAALIHDRETTERLQTYINIESSGAGAPAMLFETGPANDWLVRRWAAAAPHPRGGSFALEIYQRLPNDTDFSILKTNDIPGLNFALVGDSFAYHTARDTPERLSPTALRTAGDNVVAIVDALQQTDITQRTPRTATYFDGAGTRAIAYAANYDWVITALAVLVGLAAWLRTTRFVVGQEGAGRWLLGLAWATLAAAAVVGAMVGATWLLRTAREVYHPWYARPNRFFLLLIVSGALAGWTISRAGRWIPARAAGLRHPAVVWTYTLPLWILLAVVAGMSAPRAAYLWSLPLITAGVLLAVVPPVRSVLVRAVSVLIFAAAAVFWLRDSLELLRYIVALLGRLPFVTPVYVYAALIGLVAAMLVPPLISALALPRRVPFPRAVTAVGLLIAVLLFAWAYRTPAYTHDNPLRRHVRAFQDVNAGESLWLLGSTEPGLDIAEDAPGSWTAGAATWQTSVPAPRLREPFVFSGTGPPLGPAPALITSVAIGDLAGGLELSVTVVPREPGLTLSFVLPDGVRPARANLPGVVTRTGRWRATFVAPPPEGLTLRASFTGVAAERLRDTRVLATSGRLPGGEGWQRLPRWLPQERMVWNAEATWVLPHPTTLEPVPPLR